MLNRKNHLVIGLTTFNTELLRISIPALGNLHQKFLLVIYNGTEKILKPEYIKKLGYRGALRIINSDTPGGQLDARMAIIKHIQQLKTIPEWTSFIHDCDILLNADIPNVPSNIFAIMKKSIYIQGGLGNLFAAMDTPRRYNIDGKNVIARHPAGNTSGVIIRTQYLTNAVKVLECILEMSNNKVSKTHITIPDNGILWTTVQKTAQHIYPNTSPIYMDQVNRIEINHDFGSTKPKRPSDAIISPQDFDIAFNVAIKRLEENFKNI